VNKLLESLPGEAKKKLRRMEQPDWEDPMLATLTKQRFDDHGWIFDRKLDGERCITYRKPGNIRLMSRNRHSINTSYPEVVEALQKQSAQDFIIDGEIVAFDQKGTTKFELLQPRMGVLAPPGSGAPVFYYVFDILYYDGYDTTQLTQIDRKRLLENALSYGGALQFVKHREGGGLEFFREACVKGWEGLIAKKGDAPYIHSRSDLWLKFKCIAEQEFVIGGFTEPQGKREYFGALFLGYYQDGILKYAGKVGTGFDNTVLEKLHEKFSPLERKTSPFAEEIREKGTHWLEPVLVAQIGFEEWTDLGKMRQPRYMGLRPDKDAKDVVKEVPK
jgi:bifunctional non-homologous end joining protein LigD